jgi:3-deoxy-D-manno-octulosonate 8-phosphate phosphatase (KDO 8-P phosphatase)
MDCEMRSQHIALVVLDVDGVLTSGELVFGQDGEMFKTFHAHDGLGIAAAHSVGLKTAIITGRSSKMVEMRSAELKINDVLQGTSNKMQALTTLLAKYNLTLAQVAYVGDDLNDLPIMRQVGLACAVDNAAAEVKCHAHLVTRRAGGNGAVREVIEYILKAQGKWESVVAKYCASAVMKNRQ